MINKEIFDKLKEPFNPDDLEWRVQSSGFNARGPWVQVLTYVTARAIMDRLDEVVGPDKWQTKFEQHGTGFLCSLSVKIGDEWITKVDGADMTDVESFKGGISSSLKRAAVSWGIGRYLYGLESGFAKTSEKAIPGWNKANVKDKKSGQEAWIYWCPPELPSWALPSNDARSRIVKEASQKNQEGLKQRLGQEREDQEGFGPTKAQQGEARTMSSEAELSARAEEIKKEILEQQTFASLGDYWFNHKKEIENMPIHIRDEIIRAKDARKRFFQ